MEVFCIFSADWLPSGLLAYLNQGSSVRGIGSPEMA